jgi:thiazole/oxazole-forming peptide maturase SagD family component
MELKYLDLLKQEKLKDIFKWEEHLGPITYSFFKQTPIVDPKWWICSFKFGNTPTGSFYEPQVRASAGTSIYPEKALVRSIGEAIERYSSLNFHSEDTSYVKGILDPSIKFIRCADFEPCSEYYKKDIDHEITLVTCKSLLSNEDVKLPAEYVHLGYSIDTHKSTHPPISTGCAFYTDYDTAIWGGICEVVERDAMMRFWSQRNTPVKIDIDSISEIEFREQIKRIKEKGLTIDLFEISSVIPIPTVYAVLRGAVFPYTCVGASSNIDIIESCTKAIDEAISIYLMANWNGFKKEKIDTESFHWVNRLEKHMELYANWENTPAFDFFINMTETMTIKDLISHKKWLNKDLSLVKLSEYFKNKGFDIFWKDITVSEVKEFGVVNGICRQNASSRHKSVSPTLFIANKC